MARHAAPDTLPRHMHAAHYLTAATQDYPLVILLPSAEITGDDEGHPLPWVAVGVLPLTSPAAAAYRQGMVCNECDQAANVVVEDDSLGIGEPLCWDHLVQGDHGGVIPTCYVELVGV